MSDRVSKDWSSSAYFERVGVDNIPKNFTADPFLVVKKLKNIRISEIVCCTVQLFRDDSCV